MGRKEKNLYRAVDIKHKEIIDVREIGYYATPTFVARYIGKRMIDINSEGQTLFDPCCGKEELTDYFSDLGIKTIGMDLIKYKNNYRCEFKKENFINYYCSQKNIKKWDYDYYIANPPYNCHEVNFIKDNKERLKNYFNEVGLHNMYSMFMYAIIDKAKDGAVIGFITNDSFFTAKNHKKLRNKILRECSIHEITMCPRELFHKQGADVRTSILILRKGKQYQKKIVVNNRPKSIEEFKELLNGVKNNCNESLYNLQEIVLQNKKDNLEFLIECPEDIRSLFNNVRLGEKFKCITGISTGNDKKFLSKEKNYKFNVPFYKNPGKDKFYTDRFIYLHKNFLRIEKVTQNFNVRNKDVLYKSGITCSSMGVSFNACILPKNSTFGVNPNIICESEDVWWLLAYLNSSLVTYLVRGALIRSNMITSGYVSRIPLLSFTKDEKAKLAQLAKNAYKLRKQSSSIEVQLWHIDNIVNHVAKISNESKNLISNFKKYLVEVT
ncbi:N-6 DNA methylase [Clostridium sp.]|uniref:N-6 DNA methylase n=1 Tax=Clostridium sp. TaxID=1506 RepID=UPI002603D46C